MHAHIRTARRMRGLKNNTRTARARAQHKRTRNTRRTHAQQNDPRTTRRLSGLCDRFSLSKPRAAQAAAALPCTHHATHDRMRRSPRIARRTQHICVILYTIYIYSTATYAKQARSRGPSMLDRAHVYMLCEIVAVHGRATQRRNPPAEFSNRNRAE